MTVRYRCSGCGNLTRFDVVSSRRTRAFHHFTVGGDLQIEDEIVLDAVVESVTCRWCGATEPTVEELPADAIGTGGAAGDSGDAEAAPAG